MYTLAKASIPMDIDFMLSDTFEQLRPSLHRFKSYEEAAEAVQEMFLAVAKDGRSVDVFRIGMYSPAAIANRT